MTGHRNAGYVMLAVIISVVILTIFLLMAIPLWETEVRRDLEEELIFRARQYVMAIQKFQLKNPNIFPQNFEALHLEKFLRQMYKDPMDDYGKWDLVLQDTSAGQAKLLVVPAGMLKEYLSKAVLVGVCSRSPLTGFREYRDKKKYNEWVFYLGENEKDKWPPIEFVAEK